MVARIYLWISAIVFLGLGFALMFWPTEILKAVEVSFESPTAFADIRADYGGCIFGLSLFLIFCASKPALTRLGLLCTGLTFCGYALGRLISLIIDGMPKQIIFTLIVVELVGAAVAFGLMPLAPKVGLATLESSPRTSQGTA